jgi:signal transduction histidine kinase
MQHDQAITEKARESEERIRRLSGRLLESQEDERLRIARELHDTTAQELVALATMLSQLRSSIPTRDRNRRRLLSECKALADRCIREIRTLSYHLHPPVLDQLGLIDAVRHEAKAFSRRSGVHVELDVPSRFDRLPPRIELALFRIVQESFTNIQRHSGGKHATVRIRQNSRLILEIIDLGGGTSRAPANAEPRKQYKSGVGIQSMRERVNLIGGHFEIYRANGGTTVRVTVPLEKKNEKSSDSNR